MKKEHAYFILCMLFFCVAFSQNDTVYWSGNVLDRQSSEPVKNALIRLKLSNGGMHQAFSNDSGYYSFKLKTIFETGELSIGTDKNTHITNRKSNGFIASKDKLTFTFPKEKRITYDFILNRSPLCWLNNPPQMWFDANSTTLVPYKDPDVSDSVLAPGEIIDFYYELLNGNPEIVVELKGRCDEPEKNRQLLSEKRAQLIADKLIAKGIPAARLLVSGVGFRPPAHLADADLAPKTEEQKKLAHQKNRSVSVRIVSWDYVDPKAPKKVTAQQKSDENSEYIED